MKRCYFIKPIGFEGPIKIGCSVSPDGRRATLEWWAPFPLEVAAEIDGGLRIEAQFHAKFLAQHRHGEWFDWSPELGEVIAAIRAGTFDTATLPEPTDLRRKAGYAPRTVGRVTVHPAGVSPHSELIDRVGKNVVRMAFGLTPQVLHWWRVRGIPLPRRFAFARLCAEHAVETPADFLAEFEPA